MAHKAALAKIEKGIAGMIAAIEDGLYQPAMKARMTELERQKAEISARLAEAPQPVPAVHPNMADAYRRKVERLAETLNHPDIQHEAASALRSLIGKIVLTPGEKRGQVHADLHGELLAILDFANDNHQHAAAGTLVMSQVCLGSLCHTCIPYAAIALTAMYQPSLVAELAAITKFNLDDDQRTRLVVQKAPDRPTVWQPRTSALTDYGLLNH